MIDHFRAFRTATGDSAWDTIRNAHQTAIANLQSGFASSTGLLPDFVVNTNSSPKPAPGQVLEDPNDGQFWWNACRTPWRIGDDAVTGADSRSLAAARKLNSWIKSKTGGNPDQIALGYKLNGTQISSGSEVGLLRSVRRRGDDGCGQPGLAGRAVEQDARYADRHRQLLLGEHPAPGDDHGHPQPLGALTL